MIVMPAISLVNSSLKNELDRILNIIIEKFDPEKVILFGSMAKGNFNELSDIDLVVIMPTNLRFIERLLHLTQAVKPEVPVDFLVYTPEEEEEFIKNNHLFYTEEILKKGVILYEKRRN
jgi:predicted nucleotidyltransferase